jgi:hypothetical protein
MSRSNTRMSVAVSARVGEAKGETPFRLDLCPDRVERNTTVADQLVSMPVVRSERHTQTGCAVCGVPKRLNVLWASVHFLSTLSG